MSADCPLCLQGACMWKGTNGKCEPPARLRARVEALQAMRPPADPAPAVKPPDPSP